MGPPTISIVLATFNRLAFLRPAIESVFAQSYADWELIVADDGSEADTRSYLRGLASQRRVRLLELTHSGNPGAVRNAACRIASGKYIAFMDSDDVWLPDKLQRQLAAMKQCPGRRWSYTGLTRVDVGGVVLPGDDEHRRAVHDGAILEQLLTLRAAVATASVMVERSLMEEVGGFDEQQQYFEEYDLWLRLILRSEVCGINERLLLVRNHSQHYSADRAAVYRARLRLLDKWQALLPSAPLQSVIRLESGKTSAALAAVYAGSGRRVAALRLLWQSRVCASSYSWWRSAAGTTGRALSPAWLRAILGSLRSRRNRPCDQRGLL